LDPKKLPAKTPKKQTNIAPKKQKEARKLKE